MGRTFRRENKKLSAGMSDIILAVQAATLYALDACFRGLTVWELNEGVYGGSDH